MQSVGTGLGGAPLQTAVRSITVVWRFVLTTVIRVVLFLEGFLGGA